MTGRAHSGRFTSTEPPVVLAVTGTPLLTQALAAALEGVAVLHHLPAGVADLGGLVRHIRPDALVVDCDDEAGELTAVADELSLPFVHVSLQTQQLRVLRDQSWSAQPSWGTSPSAIRNVLLGEIYGAAARRRERLGERDPR
jgi:hypothetical protein